MASRKNRQLHLTRIITPECRLFRFVWMGQSKQRVVLPEDVVGIAAGHREPIHAVRDVGGRLWLHHAAGQRLLCGSTSRCRCLRLAVTRFASLQRTTPGGTLSIRHTRPRE